MKINVILHTMLNPMKSMELVVGFSYCNRSVLLRISIMIRAPGVYWPQNITHDWTVPSCLIKSYISASSHPSSVPSTERGITKIHHI